MVGLHAVALTLLALGVVWLFRSGRLATLVDRIEAGRRIEYLERLVHSNPTDVTLLLELATAYMMADKYDQALLTAWKATQVDSESLDAWRTLGGAAELLYLHGADSAKTADALRTMESAGTNLVALIKKLTPHMRWSRLFVFGECEAASRWLRRTGRTDAAEEADRVAIEIATELSQSDDTFFRERGLRKLQRLTQGRGRTPTAFQNGNTGDRGATP